MGAHLDGEDEAMLVSAMAAMVPAERFQHHDVAAAAASSAMRRAPTPASSTAPASSSTGPGFAGGAGCALHLAAIDAGESPMDWKPSVCWQLPIKVDWEDGPGDNEVATVRRWQRRDWGEEGETMAWCCTEGDRAYVGDRAVIDSLADELTDIVGETVFVELRRRLT